MFWGRGDSDTTTIVPTTENISNQTLTDGGESENKFETFVEHEIGGIVGLVFGLLFSAALILAAWITYRRHRARNEEYRRDMEVFLKSKRNAGVYVDTTVDTPPIVRQKDAVYDSLQQDLYEHDSEEEF
ncbi:uncharacterized protein LOC133173918 [Saccostrea echinata]|uniref:uncharacterized protein LOC133173918 n=1 Tax=Saccostrea echinata TaxID=191078 RepID=UPI002A835E24|nr:uncharacterized protein LOC133173918 [Saccostrea echinata]